MRTHTHNQYRNTWTHQITFWKCLASLLFFMLLVIFFGAQYKRWLDREWVRHLVSPIPEVMAFNESDHKKPPTVENVMAYIARSDKFGKHGPYVAARAAMCFVTEGMSHVQGDKTMINTRRMNYNCAYEVDGKTKYTSCPEQDFDKAWSVDCGVAQINVPGRQCPEKLFDYEHNIDVALQKYEARGDFSAWYGKGCN